ncbi:MAG: hypothetical protein PHU81_04765 [Acidobacteriota bacterium]|nr:hypothetical protein [Acidobacteriota bacterium]
MNKCRDYRSDWLAFLRGELEADRRQVMKEHLNRCSCCQKELRAIKNFISQTDNFHNELKETMAGIDWDKLQLTITGRAFEQKARREDPRPATGFKLGRWQPVAAGLIAGLLLGAFFTFLWMRSGRLDESGARKESGISLPAGFVQRVDLALAQRQTIDYLDRSQFLLLELVQSKTANQASSFLTQDKVQKLLTEKKYLNSQLNEIKLAKAKMLCDQIEMLFLELVQLSPQMSDAELENLREIIESRQLLLKINLVKKELQQGEA